MTYMQLESCKLKNEFHQMTGSLEIVENETDSLGKMMIGAKMK